MPPSVAVATTFIALKAGCGVETSMEFLRQVRVGDVPDKPPFVLRNRLIQMGGVVGHSRDAVFCLALTIKAWNAYVTGANISVLRWNPSQSEPFPVMLDTDGVVIEETRKAHDRDR